MRPSPSLRGSLRRDSVGDIHKRGRSLESGLSFKRQEDDLALFNEMQSRQMDNFLLESTDGFEDLLSSKMKPYPEFKLGINIAARGESNDLLNDDADKNDYEWLLTPPETPLFPSMDDEPASVDLVHNGRGRSRPISLSRSSTVSHNLLSWHETTYIRPLALPLAGALEMEKSNRSSRGSRSPQHLSPSPRSGKSTSRGRPSSASNSHAVPLRSSSPSRRPSPPPVKPLTPPPRSLTPTSRRTTGASPVRRNRGNSASPKVRAWQSSIPGFSLEAPPNLLTSLADRPASYIRGSSPASRASRESNSKFGRQSMSPTASRSINSAHSQERDRLSSHNKGSIASSGDDDADSFQSDPDSVHERSMSRKGVSGRPLAFPKKITKTISPSSAPKRSFDSAMRQMDRAIPQNMFRPLLSGVPGSTIYSGKTTSTDHTLASRNSYVTTISNARSDLARSAARDTEGSVLSPDDMASDCARATFSDTYDEVFVFDKMDVGPEDSRHEGHDFLPNSQLGELGDSEEFSYHDFPIESDNTFICSICGSRYHPDDLAETEYNNINVCWECKQKELSSSNICEGTPEVSEHDSQLSQSYLENSPSASMEVENLDVISMQEVTIEHKTDTNIDVVKGSGISVLLNRSNSAKGPIVLGRTVNSSAISFEDLSYARDLTSSMTSSIGHGSFSASSSISSTSTRHGEMFVRRQWSGKLSDSSSKPQSTVSSFSATSLPMNRSYGHSTSSHEGSFEGALSNLRPTSPLDRVTTLENAMLCNKGSLVAGVPVTEGNNDDVENTSQASVIVDESHLTELNCHKSSFAEEGTMSDNRVHQVEIADGVTQCSLSSMSEIEINDSHPSSPRSQIDVVVKEDLEDCSTAIHHDTDARDTSLASDRPDLADKIVEESTVAMKDEGGRRTRSLTLEEATDTILFCSAIIHDLAYKAANIAIEKENENLKPLEGSSPTVTIPDKSSSDRKNSSRFSTGRTPKTQKARKRQTSETKVEPPLTQNDDGPVKPVVRNVGLPNKTDSMKPPKLESKCNCTIM
ncbi:hypothetical protein KSS87_020063 [Heliosperma pusillum]|nr:hypothetical protein KSS87_020063 [Heliosperma pusillum]